MKRLTIACVLAALSSGVTAADWVTVNDTDDYIAYADPASILRTGSHVRMWDLIDLKYPQSSPIGDRYSSSKANSEFDCEGERVRTLHFSLHAGRMGDGDIVQIAAVSNKWLPVTHGSLLKILWQFACGAK